MHFQYPIHNQILKILQSVNSSFFKDCSIYFGGGTMLALAYGEYRLSRNIEFLCPFGETFSKLRRSLFKGGYDTLFDLPKSSELSFPREMRTDRDGVRFAVQSGEVTLKFEIVAEGRINLETPSQPDWSPVACLSLVDQVAEKLLANGDRWPDQSVYSRDLIDLSILKQKTDFPDEAIAKAEAAYPTIEPLRRSLQAFQSKPYYRQQCYEKLEIAFPAAIIDGLDLLSAQFGLSPFSRQSLEINK